MAQACSSLTGFSAGGTMRSPKQLWAVVAAVGVGAGVVCTPAASITGLVKYEGEAPAMKPVAMDADPVCAGKHAEPVLAETLVLGPTSS
jgi:hypothetical protein